ncbi:MAG: sugar ABC transporter ATP-binding protein [Actinobacteria bacterium]|nr:sugar ABC transporter ATP-binding protein [Actinomycetota bacterium]
MTTALSVQHASKIFGAQVALDDVSIDVAPGEVRALVGQNGCGKSTLIKILAGFHQPEPGTEASVGGETLPFLDPIASEAVGLRFVHQDLGLVGNLDAVDNMAMGQGYITRGLKTINWLPVAGLQMSERTAVAIARAMSDRGSPVRMLILDEPTANLPDAEAQRLYSLVRRVADSGVAVLFVSHHFDEVFEMADSVTVLRDGKHIITRPVEGLSEEELIELVIGRNLEEHNKENADAREHGLEILNISGVAGGSVTAMDLTIHRGEVVGVAGITGSGRETVAPIVFGGIGHSGEISVDGKVLPPNRPDISIERGVALVPAERHANASLLDQTLRENITLVDPGRHMTAGILRRKPERADVRIWLDKLTVKPGGQTEYTMAQLSGGNQQKVILARWLRQEPEVLILDEPTQGVDVGAKADIHRLIDEAAAQGAAVLVCSTDHEELVRVCDRVIIMRRGKVASTLRGREITADNITAATIGRDTTEPAA